MKYLLFLTISLPALAKAVYFQPFNADPGFVSSSETGAYIPYTVTNGSLAVDRITNGPGGSLTGGGSQLFQVGDRSTLQAQGISFGSFEAEFALDITNMSPDANFYLGIESAPSFLFAAVGVTSLGGILKANLTVLGDHTDRSIVIPNQNQVILKVRQEFGVLRGFVNGAEFASRSSQITTGVVTRYFFSFGTERSPINPIAVDYVKIQSVPEPTESSLLITLTSSLVLIIKSRRQVTSN